MDIISFNEASTANGRIENFIENPDSMSGVVTVPKVIASGETITIPAGRVAVLPNVQVDGTLNIEGEVFIPAGATFSKVVETEGNQTIAGVKTFSSSPVVPTPTTGTQAVNKDYVDTGAGAAFVVNDNRVKTALNATGNAPIYACRAWVNFNGTGTVAIRASGNVSSITDRNVGLYTVNLSTAMPDVNYASVLGLSSYGTYGTDDDRAGACYNISTSAIGVSTSDQGPNDNSYTDSSWIHLAVFR